MMYLRLLSKKKKQLFLELIHHIISLNNSIQDKEKLFENLKIKYQLLDFKNKNNLKKTIDKIKQFNKKIKNIIVLELLKFELEYNDNESYFIQKLAQDLEIDIIRLKAIIYTQNQFRLLFQRFIKITNKLYNINLPLSEKNIPSDIDFTQAIIEYKKTLNGLEYGINTQIYNRLINNIPLKYSKFDFNTLPQVHKEELKTLYRLSNILQQSIDIEKID